MSRSDSPTEPPQGYAFPSNVDPPWATPPGLPGSSTDRSPRAVPNYPGEPGGCGHPLLHHRWQASSRMAAWPLSVCVTRPNRVRLRYGSRVRLRQASSGESLHRPLARLPVEWVITGQAPFSLQDQPGLSWHSIHRAFCDVCDPRGPASERRHGKHRHVCATQSLWASYIFRAAAQSAIGAYFVKALIPGHIPASFPTLWGAAETKQHAWGHPFDP